MSISIFSHLFLSQTTEKVSGMFGHLKLTKPFEFCTVWKSRGRAEPTADMFLPSR